MKTFLTAITISLILILLAVGLQVVEVANANPMVYGPPRIAIASPQYGVTYNSSQVTLSVGIQLFGYTYASLEVISWARYAVDNGITAPINLEMPTVVGPGTMINSTNIISNLSDGNHTINVFLETSFAESASANVTFIVDAKPGPTPSLSPAQIPKPSVPEFTLSLGVSSSQADKPIVLTINNQPFVPYYDASSGWNISLYYNIRMKTHLDENWTNLYQIEDVPTQSNSDYTVLSYHLVDAETSSYILGDKMWELPNGSQLDFQVEAMIGYIHRVQHGNFAPYYFTGETSNWSNTQTITIAANTPSPTPTQSANSSPNLTPTVSPSSSPTQQPTTQPSQTPNNAKENFTSTAIIIGLVVAVAVLTVLLIYAKKIKK